MPQANRKLIGKVDLMIAAAEPGLVLTEEMAEAVIETLMKVKFELKREGRCRYHPDCLPFPVSAELRP